MRAPFDLVVAGGSPAGLSVGIQALRAGLEKVLIVRLPEFDLPGLPTSIRPLAIQDVGSLDLVAGGTKGEPLRVDTDRGSFYTEFCVVDLPAIRRDSAHFEIPSSIIDRIHTTDDFEAEETDVLVVGEGEMTAIATLTEPGAVIPGRTVVVGNSGGRASYAKRRSNARKRFRPASNA